jgi:S1-C subfamily serine protease
MRTACGLILAASLLVGAKPAHAQSADERAAAREVVKTRGGAVVVVLATVRLRVNVGGTEQPPADQPISANATVLDATGLAVMSLAAIQPDATLERSLRGRAGGAGATVTSEISEMRMHLADGRELPAKVVLKDEDLDLAFIQPTGPAPTSMRFVDAPSMKPNLLDALVVLQRTTEATGWQTVASFGLVQLILDKPRTYYLGSFATLGSAIFDTTGKFAGVVVNRNTGTRGVSSPALLPADDIREVAKQVVK